MDDREWLLSLLRTKALETRKVTLSSGKISNHYIDCRRVTLSPVGAYLTGKLMLGMIDKNVSAVGGLTLGADPIVTSIAVLSHIVGRYLPAMIIRKEVKRYGTMSFIEGPYIEQGSKVAIVDDVVTTGISLLSAIQRVLDAGFDPVQVLAIIDRQEGGRETIEAAGYQLESIFSWEEIK